MKSTPISSISLHYDYDLVAARRRARQVAALFGFDEQDQTRISTVASEIARNALRYGRGGRIEFHLVEEGAQQALQMAVTDRGPGIPNLSEVLGGNYRSSTGMGIGITGARRLMDAFEIITSPEQGTSVVMRKNRPAGVLPIARRDVEALVDQLARQKPENPLEEIQQQNGELLAALATLSEKQNQLEHLNQELEDTNRGVLALYAELDEKADHLRRADQLKTRFLSDMSHEFRTPVNSILALTRLAEEEVTTDDGRKQIGLIRRAADDLATLVNDLLDLAKIEAGKIEIHPAEFEIDNLFSALRGMLRPLLLNRSLSLVFEDPEGSPVMNSDEAKISQILRNFISNALKFTEAGEVRVTASAQQSMVLFTVTDTGIGIAPEDQERIFEEFTQVDSPIQRRHHGTGLGLPLTRRLAALLGGRVGVRSEKGAGSSFWAEIPREYTGSSHDPQMTLTPPGAKPPTERTILLIDDDETARYTLSNFARREKVRIVEAENGMQGISRAQAEHPDLILLDLMMPGIGGHEVLARLKSDQSTSAIPVVVVSSRFLNDAEREEILTHAAGIMNKADLSRDLVTRTIDDVLARERGGP
jgi:Signal transduction histidine kinase